MKDLIDIKYWIFDLDNTLYSGQTQVFSEVDKKMSSFISEKFNVDLIKAKEIPIKITKRGASLVAKILFDLFSLNSIILGFNSLNL